MTFVVKKTDIDWVVLIEPKVFGDERWFFMETYNKSDFIEEWIDCDFVQDNHSKSSKWVLRWFHFQTKNTQAKLVRVTKWAVLDFAIDIRKDSPTYGKYIVEKLNEQNKRQLFVPKWFAHGFLTLEDDTEFLYKCDDYYNQEWEWGIIWNDKDINIDRDSIKAQHNISEFILSEKDTTNQTLKQFWENNPF